MRATAIVRRPAVKAAKIVGEVELPHRERKLGTGRMVTAEGAIVELALAREVAFEDGDALKLETGDLILVKASAERLLEVSSESPARLVRIAWHLGDQHVPMEAGESCLYVPAHPAAAEIVRGLGGAAKEVRRAFKPERAQGHHHHDHDHGDGHHHHHHEHDEGCGCGHDHHDHGHDHSHGHAHDHAHARDHEHPAHDHAHDHDHGHAQGHGHKHG